MRQQEIEALKSALKQQLQLYQQMLNIAKEQKEKVSDITFLFASLKQKQELVLKIQTIDDKITDLKNIWKRDKNSLPQDQRSSVEQIFDEISSVLQELLELEGLLSKEINSNKKQLEKQLSQVHAGKKAIKAYYKPNRSDEARFVDRKQ